MTTKPLFPRRVERLRTTMRTLGLDAYLVAIEANRRYLSGYSAEDGQFDETAGMLIITADQLLLATDSRYELQAREEAAGYEIVCYRNGLMEELSSRFADLDCRRVGFESVRMSVRQHRELSSRIGKTGKNIELVPLEAVVEDQRACKDAQEIAATRRAVACAETAFKKLREVIRPGLAETEIARMLEDFMRAEGAEGPSFPIIVASGPNSALPHAVPGERRLQPGEPLLLDWGARVDGYCSDISRTLFGGTPDAQFRQCYRTVQIAQAAAIDAIRAGQSGRDVDAVARGIIREAGFKGRFGHSLGHGTGLFIHEAPRLSPRSDDVLKTGMLVTVEPGIYLPDWGGVRLENQVCVREDGAEILNTLDLEDFILPV
ncbi:MAG: Xaa-Pro peptidase family protein [Desulfobacterales bacterium]|nr:Xaa-Pro peptidase family protein [Desulfobacterales bacterium]